MTYDTFLRSPLICTGSQSPMAKIEHWGIAALLLVATVNNASAQEREHNLPATAAQTYVQAWLGTMEADDAWSLDDPSTGVRLEADYSSIPLGGGVSQLLWGASVQIGFEGGGLVSFKNDAVIFAGADPGLRVSIDNEFFLTELFMGGVVSLRPSHWLRPGRACPSYRLVRFGFLPMLNFLLDAQLIRVQRDSTTNAPFNPLREFAGGEAQLQLTKRPIQGLCARADQRRTCRRSIGLANLRANLRSQAPTRISISH